jgi:ADP-ribose pyrophosphatase
MPDPVDHRHLFWRESSREELVRSPIFTLFRSERYPAAPEAVPRSGSFYLLEARDWVTVVPVLPLPDGREAFLMVRQYRHGIDRVTLEFPAGIAEADEAPEAAARRELREETGCESRELTLAATVAAAPAFMTNWCHVFVARGVERVGFQALDPGELLDAVTVPVDEIVAGMGSGELVNSITVAALCCYMRRSWASRGER